MIKKKNFLFLDKNFVLNYFFRLLIINLFGLFFLYDTDSFNQGLVSIQSIFYSINTLLAFFFILIEFISSILQFYGLDHKFLSIIFLDIKSINLLFVYEIILTILNYILFLVFVFLIICFRQLIIKNISNKRLIFSIIFLSILLMFFNIDFSKKLFKKIYNINNNLNEYSLFRHDNWFLYYKYKKTISKNKDIIENSDFLDNFSSLINSDLHNNIFIVINESYPNFKNQKIKYNLLNHIYDEEIKESFELNNYITDWSREYSTQGAELKLFCGDNLNFNEFKKKDLRDFIDENNCYFKKFDDFYKIFIHTYLKTSFSRERYDNYFDKTYFYKDLENRNFEICEGRPFTGYCDHQVIETINDFKRGDKNLIIFLTVNNHIPVKLIKKVNLDYCKRNFPLNINDQFCFIYQNQVLFNKGLKTFIKSMKKEDFLIYYSDTPPIFPSKHRIHFEDYIDVYTFKKK
tara:strand:- start:417 stop:1799 length:1383 start_codon:yes stop_codon:yes gene_type:complete